ncbi:hypothetical protein FOZ63_008064, partial [Perkinsus olseni]
MSQANRITGVDGQNSPAGDMSGYSANTPSVGMSPTGSSAERPIRTGPKIFIGGVPYTATEKDVADFFSQFGPVVSAEIKMDKVTGRSRGFGFVVFETAEGKMGAMRRKGELYLHNRQINIGE